MGIPESKAEATVMRLSLGASREPCGLRNAPLLGFHLNAFRYYLCDFEGYVTSCSSSVKWG